jgi:hypothetical protein
MPLASCRMRSKSPTFQPRTGRTLRSPMTYCSGMIGAEWGPSERRCRGAQTAARFDDLRVGFRRATRRDDHAMASIVTRNEGIDSTPTPGRAVARPQLVGGDDRDPLGQRDHAPAARQGRRVVPRDPRPHDRFEAGPTQRHWGDARPTQKLRQRLNEVAPTITRPSPSHHNRSAHRVDGTGARSASVRMASRFAQPLAQKPLTLAVSRWIR